MGSSVTPASVATCWTISSSVTFPSRRPSVNANPELVVASASKPSASNTRAEPASHGFGITNGSPAWSSRKAVAFSCCVLIGDECVLDRAGERVASGRLPVLVASREPATALLRGAVRPRLRVHLALRLLLDAVVADRVRRVEALVDVGLGQLFDHTCRHRVCRPHARVAVGLELRPDGLALGSLPVAADAVEDSELVLNVVAILMRDHVGLSERAAARAEPRLQLVEEAEVDVHALVGWAIERADLRTRGAAARLDLVGEEDRVHVRIPLAASLKDAVPEALDAVHHADDPAVLALVCVL